MHLHPVFIVAALGHPAPSRLTRSSSFNLTQEADDANRKR